MNRMKHSNGRNGDREQEREMCMTETRCVRRSEKIILSVFIEFLPLTRVVNVSALITL